MSNYMRKFVLLIASAVFSAGAYAATATISSLPAASALSGTEVLEIVQISSKKVTAAQIATYVRSVTTKSDVGLGNVDNTSDATKNTATATLSNKTLASPVINTPTGLTKSDVGLSNVDNTADASKAVATAAALAANGTNCSAGNYARGGDASGNAENCTADADTFAGKAVPSSVVVGTTDTQTLTNKTISGSSNTFSNIPDGALSANVALLNFANPFTASQTISNAEPRRLYNETDASTNEKLWDQDVQSKIFCLRTRTDADAAGVNSFCVTRSTGTAISNVSFGNPTNNPTFTFAGTGMASFGGAIGVASSIDVVSYAQVRAAIVTGTVIGSGVQIATPGANRMGFYANSTLRGEFDANGKLVVASGYLPDAGGLKHARITTGSISGGATALITITWTTAFADANYTPACSVLDSTNSSLSLTIVHVETQSASALAVRVLNNAVGSLTGTLNCMAVHD